MSVEFSATVIGGDGPTAVIAIGGEIDMQTAPNMQAAIDGAIAEGFTSITLDMAGVTFMDSSGLAVIAATIQQLRVHDSRLAVQHPTEIVEKVLEISRLAGELEISSDGSSPRTL